MNLSMTVRTNQRAFLDLILHSFPRSCVAVRRNTEIFLRRIYMVKFECREASIISADLTLSALVDDGLFSDFLAPFCDSPLKVIGTIGIGSRIFLHMPIEYAFSQSTALPLSYLGLRMCEAMIAIARRFFKDPFSFRSNAT